MQTIGERLEEARKKKGISIREAAEATKIRGDYLQKFESNQFDIGLTEIYTRGFLRSYATFLKLPADRILNDYASLGRGESRRQPSREVYGRMDVSTTTADEMPARPAPAAAPAPAPEPAATAENAAPRAAQPRYPRGGGSALPSGPDPALVFKWAKIAGGVVVLLIVVLLLKGLMSGGSSTPKASASRTAATTAAPAVPHEPSVTLLATNVVRVSVETRNPDGTRRDLLFEKMMSRGETASVPRTETIYISASAAENLTLEINGRSYPMATQPGLGTGYQVAKIDPPRA